MIKVCESSLIIKFFKRVIFCFIIVLIVLPTRAQNIYRYSEPPPEETELPEEETTLGEELLGAHQGISNWFKSAADGLDLFIVGKRVTKRANETQVQVINTSYSMEGQEVLNQTLFTINPRLPNLEEFFKLTFTSYDERAERRGVNQNYLRNSPRDTNYGTTLSFFQRLEKVRVTFQPRVELQDPLKVSHSLAFESIAKYKIVNINPKFELFANPTSGTGVFGAFNFHYTLNKTLSLAQINQGTYEEKQRYFNTLHGISLDHALDDVNILSYGLIFLSNNRPKFHLDLYSFSITHAVTLYKEIIDLKVTPHLDFSRASSFKGQAGVTASLILTF